MRLHTFVTATVASLFLATSQPVFSQQSSEMNMADFKNTMISYVELLGSDELLRKYDSLTPDEWKAMYDAFPNKGEFAQAVQKMEGRAARAQSDQLSPQGQRSERAFTVPATEFTPRYPQSPAYDAIIATPLRFLGLLNDGDLPGTQDDRCNNDGEASTRLVYEALEIAAIALDASCSSLLIVLGTGTNVPFCVAAGAANEAVHLSQVILDHCTYQNSHVDSAEIEGAYENTRRLITTLNNVDTQLMQHDTDVKAILSTLQATANASGGKLDLLLARQLEVIRLLHTPEGQRSTQVPACNGGPCIWNSK